MGPTKALLFRPITGEPCPQLTPGSNVLFRSRPGRPPSQNSETNPKMTLFGVSPQRAVWVYPSNGAHVGRSEGAALIPIAGIHCIGDVAEALASVDGNT